MSIPKKAPARVGSGKGKVDIVIRNRRKLTPESTVEQADTPSHTERNTDQAELWAFTIPMKRRGKKNRIPTVEELTRRKCSSITPDEREAMKENDDVDEDWKFITIPPPGKGHNSGLARAAWILLKVFERSDEEAKEHLCSLYTRDSVDVIRAVENVIARLEGDADATRTSSKTSKQKLPSKDSNLVSKISQISLTELREKSPSPLEISTLDALRHLMRHAGEADPLVCVGASASDFQTLRISDINPNHAGNMQFLVPSAMSAPEGNTLAGHLSPKSNDNTGLRLNLVYEGDDLSKEQQAGIVSFLAQYVPLVCAVDSGGKSIHAFFDVAGRSPEEQERLMKSLCRLGADSHLWTISQFARMPGGTRPASEEKPEISQEILYLDLDPPSIWRIDELEAWMMERSEPPEAKTSLVWGVNSYPTVVPIESVILGRSWLRRGDIGNLVSSAGSGKSVAATQAPMAWGLGLPYFGITPPRPLRILLFSGEDDGVTIGQCREGFLEHSEAITGRQLTTLDLVPLDAVLRTEFSREHVGGKFHSYLDVCLTRSPADLVIINPLLSFIGGEIVSCASEWLRAGLMPILQTHDCAALVIHHTPKLMKGSWDTMDDTYSAIGGGEIANIPRSILTLKPTPAEGLYVLTVAKRQTTGWKDGNGKFCTSYFLRRSGNPERPAWIPVSWDSAREQIGGAGMFKHSSGRKKVNASDAADLVERSGEMSRQALIKALMALCKCSDRPARDAISDAEASGLIFSTHRPGHSGGKPEKWFSPNHESNG